MLENVYSELNNYQYILTIDSINNEIRLKCLVEENTDSVDYSTYDIDNVVTLDYLKDNNINFKEWEIHIPTYGKSHPKLAFRPQNLIDQK
jgi:hypothetical protein